MRGAWWSPFFRYHEWARGCDDFIPHCWNYSAEFECVCEPVPVKTNTWGAIKVLYR
jgi:hypothetical protein